MKSLSIRGQIVPVTFALLGSCALSFAATANDAADAQIYAKAEARQALILRDTQPAVEGEVRAALTPCSGGFADVYPCQNVDLLAVMPTNTIGGGSGNDIWGWTDPQTGKEYALMGRTSGTSFIDISDPENPVYLANLPAPTSNSTWRDIKTFDDHAFVVSEANNSGMQVFDLTRLRNINNPPITVNADAQYTGFSRAHNIVINEDSGFAYGVGTNTCSGGLHMVDINNPTNPQNAGCVSSDGYTHDAQCVNYTGPDPDHQGREICVNSNEDTVTVFDVTNKSNAVMLSRTGYPGTGYTHQGWLTEDHQYFLLDDELDESFNGNNTRTRIWDMTNLDAPVIIGIYDAATAAIDHNQYIHQGKAYQANYRAGLRILDTTQIASGNLSEIGFFDIYPANNSASFNGAWSVYPFFASGSIIVSGIEQGMFVVRMADGGGPGDYTLLPTSPGLAGTVNGWTTVNGIPNAGNLVYFGLSTGQTSISIGGCSVQIGLTNARPIGFSNADGSGTATASRSLPGGVSGLTVNFQALDLGNCDTSNITTTTF